MKFSRFIFLGMLIFISSNAVFADIKIKSKQSMSSSGQSFENTTYIKGKRQRSETMNGMSVNITQCDLRRAIQMNPAAKTFTVNEFGQIDATTDTTKVKANSPTIKGGRVISTINIKDTGERKQMFGFQARRLIITMDTNSTPDACNKTNSKIETDGWYVDFDVNFDCDQTFDPRRYDPPSTKGGCQDKYEMKQTGSGKRGYPLYEKMTMFDEAGEVTMTMINEVVELSKDVLDQSLFEVPPGYREVKDASQLYDIASMTAAANSDASTLAIPKSNSSSNADLSNTVEPKKPGTVRIGIAYVKVDAVGEGVSSTELSEAVRNTMATHLKQSNVDVVSLDAKLQNAIESEAKEKDCDYVVYLTVSHKKGGGGFGKMFGSAIGKAVANSSIGHTGSTAGNIAVQTAKHTIISAATVSSQIKAKDELTLDLLLNKGGVRSGAKQFKAKASSDGDDLISKLVNQAAANVASLIGK